jgi:acyl-CoA thioesterase FadM
MNLLFRFFYILLFARFQKPLDFLDKCRTNFRVMPTDLDLLMHMNNGKYCSLMDLARVDLMMRSGVAKIMKNNDYYPVLAAETIRFKKSLRLFKSFYIQTNIIAWDEKYFYLEQIFYRHDEIYAHAIVKARMLHKKGDKVSPADCLKAAGKDVPSPAFPDYLQSWIPVSEL